MTSDRKKHWIDNEDVVWTNVDGQGEADDITLEPIDPETDKARRAIREMEQPPLKIIEEVAPEPDKFQFTIKHILIANVVIAVAFALVRIFAPSGMAGLFGFAVFVSGVVLAVYQPDHPLVSKIWWGMVAMYVVFCVYALAAS